MNENRNSKVKKVQLMTLCFATLICSNNASSMALSDTIEFNGHRYHLFTETGTTWLQAQAIAAGESVTLNDGTVLKGHLLTINNQAEQDFISSTFMTTWWRKLWLGGFQYSSVDEPVGYWAWLTGEDMGNILTDWSYNYVDSGQPGNDSNPFNENEDVLRMLMNNGSGGPPGTGQDRWNDFPHQDGAGDSVGRFVIEFDRIGDNFICLNVPPKIRILSGPDWKSSASLSTGWEMITFDDSSWNSVRSPYPSPVAPSTLIPGTNAQHMWHDPTASSDGLNGANVAYFRYSFNYIQAPNGASPIATATINVDDDYSFYVNGSLVFENHDNGFAHIVDTIDFSPYLQNGKNVIAIHAVDGGWSGPYNRLFERVTFDATIESTLRGDFDTNCCVDRNDMQIILSEVRSPTPHDSHFDLNEDSSVNVADVRFLTTLFSKPRGVTCE